MGKYHILKEYANGVMDEKGKFYPYYIKRATSAVPAFSGRYFIKTVTVVASNTGIHAAVTTTYAGATIKGEVQYLAVITLPVTTADVPTVTSATVDCSVLADMNTEISCSCGSDTDYAVIVYAKINESEGEYDG